MVYLLKYEWHKFIRTKKNWLVFLLILCSFIGYVSFNGYQNHVYIEAKTEQFSKARQNAMYDITNMANYQFLAKKKKTNNITEMRLNILKGCIPVQMIYTVIILLLQFL